jgi:hypothetical protein
MLLAVVLVAACATQKVATYATVASVCTAEKQRLIERASSPPTPQQETEFHATRNTCDRILREIEHANE